MYRPHFSWNSFRPQDLTTILETLPPVDMCIIPEYDMLNFDSHIPLSLDVHKIMTTGAGCCILRNVYSKEIMNEFNNWCEGILEEAKQDPNSTHPIQPDKYLINDVISRLAKSNTSLLVELLNNYYLTSICDSVLGMMCYGSVTSHWINPAGSKQQSHVDYPIHFRSSPFWNGDMDKLKRMITKDQMEHILPNHSIQAVIATDAMNKHNGSTEVVLYSQNIELIDIRIQEPEVKDALEGKFISVELNQGDVLLFSRNVVHRGGANSSNKRRNALILQCVHLFAVPQEEYDYDDVQKRLQNCTAYNSLSCDEKEEFLIRLKQPFPRNVKIST